MSNVTVLNDVQRHLLQQTPIEKYVLDLEDMQQFSNVVIKSNAIIDMELYGQDELRLHGMDVQVLSTTFLMAQCLKQQRVQFDANTVFEIPLSVFCELWKIPFTDEEKKKGYVYRELRDSAVRLNLRNFIYPNVERNKMVESGYFSYIQYDQTVVQFSFPLPIIEYINLNQQYTWYFFENVVKLQGVSETYRIAQYATLLYEQIQRSKFKSRFNTKKASVVEMTTEKLKRTLGVEEGKYKRHIDFRVKVLDKIVEFIHERIGMNIDITNLSMGKRGVNGYRFTAYMTESDLDFITAINKAKEAPIMTISQRMKFAPQLISHTTFDSMYRQKGEKNEVFINRVEKLLADNEKVVEFEPYLRALKFNSKKFDAYISKLDEEVKKKIVASREGAAQGSLDLDEDTGDLPF